MGQGSITTLVQAVWGEQGGKEKQVLPADMKKDNSEAASPVCHPTRAAVPSAEWRPEGTSLKTVIGGASEDPLENTNRASPASRATRNRLAKLFMSLSQQSSPRH